jgi:hypothetical protein
MKKVNKVALVAMSAALAACSENMTAPTADLPDAPVVEGSTQDLGPRDTITFSMTIDPNRQTVANLGSGNTVTFPAGSVCDPYRSSYGDGEWDKPCTKATFSVTVNVMIWTDRWGHARVDFDKHIRFVPSNNPSQWVVITFADLQASLDPLFNILYCASSYSSCRDESKTDYSLKPTKNPITGKITRRIKHFSGYNVAAGRDDDTPTDDYRWWGAANMTTNPTLLVATINPPLRPKSVELLLSNERVIRHLSGYILASG